MLWIKMLAYLIGIGAALGIEYLKDGYLDKFGVAGAILIMFFFMLVNELNQINESSEKNNNILSDIKNELESISGYLKSIDRKS